MRKTITFIFSCCIFLNLYAKHFNIQYNKEDNHLISVYVRDSLTKEYLPATIILSNNKDTLIQQCNPKNTYNYILNAKFKNIFNKKDSIKIEVSLLGYNTFKYKFKPNKNSYNIYITLSEKTSELTAIIIKDKTVNMIVNGDTTTYNTSHIKSMEGDKLRNLIIKLPGVAIKNGILYAGNKQVSKVLINNSTLFGNHINDALNLIESNNVKKIKVYDTHQLDRVLESDTLKTKERVINIITKKIINKVKALTIGGNLHYFISKHNKNKKIGGSSNIDLAVYQINKPIISVKSEYNNNNDIPNSSTKSSIRISHYKRFLYRWSNNLSFQFNKNINKNESKTLFKNNNKKKLLNKNSSKNKDYSINYYGTYTGKFNKDHNFSTNISINYSNTNFISENFSILNINKNIFKTNIKEEKRNGIFKGHFLFSNQYISPKSHKSTIKTKIDYKTTFSKLNNYRRDTLNQSIKQFSFTDKGRVYSHIPSLSFEYNTSIFKNNRLSLKYSFTGHFSYDKLIAWDNLMNQENILATKDYTHRNIVNKIELYSTQLLNKIINGLVIKIGVQYKNIQQLTKEKYPTNYSKQLNYNIISPSFRLMYNKGVSNLIINYSENSIIPSIEQLRDYLDFRNPMFLRIGNPKLKLPLSRTLSILHNINLDKISSYIKSSFQFFHTTNCIVNKITTFNSNTILKDYNNYIALAGSQLSKPVNGKYSFSIVLSLDSEHLISSWQTKFSPSFSYRISESPFVLSQNHKNQISLLIFSLRISNFSFKNFNTEVNFNYSNQRDSFDKNIDTEINKLNFNINSKIDIFKRVRLITTFNSIIQSSNRELFKLKNFDLSCSINYSFGKRRQAILSLYCNNILDNIQNSTQYNQDQQLIRSINQSVFGRALGLSFQYTFQ